MEIFLDQNAPFNNLNEIRIRRLLNQLLHVRRRLHWGDHDSFGVVFRNGVEIADSLAVTLAYRRMIRPRTKSTTRKTLVAQIAAFGARESEAIMKIYLRLRQA